MMSSLAYASTLAFSIFVSVSLTASLSLSTVKSPRAAHNLKMSHGLKYSGGAVGDVTTINGMSSPAHSFDAANSIRHQPRRRHDVKSQMASSSDACLTGGTTIHIMLDRRDVGRDELTAAVSWATSSLCCPWRWSALLRAGAGARLRDRQVVEPDVHVRQALFPFLASGDHGELVDRLEPEIRLVFVLPFMRFRICVCSARSWSPFGSGCVKLHHWCEQNRTSALSPISLYFPARLQILVRLPLRHFQEVRHRYRTEGVLLREAAAVEEDGASEGREPSRPSLPPMYISDIAAPRSCSCSAWTEGLGRAAELPHYGDGAGPGARVSRIGQAAAALDGTEDARAKKLDGAARFGRPEPAA